jgi:hypothetical protein
MTYDPEHHDQRSEMVETLVGRHVVLWYNHATFHSEVVVLADILLRADINGPSHHIVMAAMRVVVDKLADRAAKERSIDQHLIDDITSGRALWPEGTQPPRLS